MGRYYDGDIEGKFWFGVQDSDDADFFGVEGFKPNYLDYDFYKEDLPKVQEGIKECIDNLGKFKKKLDDFFKETNIYNNKDLSKKLKVSERRLKEILEWYARLELGIKIRDSIIENDECHFEAEL